MLFEQFWTRVRLPPPPPLREKDLSIFDWFKKPVAKTKKPNFETQDGIEDALWEIKETYDLETEEIERTVFDKRHKINYMNECIKNNTPDK